MTVTYLDSDIWDPRGNSLSKGGVDLLASQQTIMPTSRWIDIRHLSCIFYLLSSSSNRPNQTTPLDLLAPASHGWLRLRRPTVLSNVGHSLPLFPTRHVILRRRQPQHAPAPEPVNPRTPLRLRLDRHIFHGSCSFHPRPWFAHYVRCAALLHCQRHQQPRGTRI